MSTGKYKALLEQILVAAREAAMDAAAEQGNPFNEGLVMAYYDILTVAIGEAKTLSVP